jgi:DNA polymerase elongation subunit (family B)
METEILTLLEGVGPYGGTEYVRAVETNNWSNKGTCFIRKPGEDEVLEKEIKYKPFIYIKKIDFNRFYTKTKIEIEVPEGGGLPSHIKYRKKNYEIGTDEANLLYNEGNKYVIEIFFSDINDRKSFFSDLAKKYGISVTKLEIDNNVSRLANGFRYLLHINPGDDKNPKYSENPDFLYKKEKKRKIRGSFNDLLNFLREGGVDPYEKNGVFLSKEKSIKCWQETKSINKKIFLLASLDLFKSANLDLPNFFDAPIEHDEVIFNLKELYKKTIEGEKENIIIVDIEKSEKTFSVESSGKKTLRCVGSPSLLILHPELHEAANVWPFLEGHIKMRPESWEICAQYVADALIFLKKNIDASNNKYHQIGISTAYMSIFGDNFADFVSLLRLSLEEIISPPPKLNKSNLSRAIDYMGVERCAAELPDKFSAIGLNPDFFDGYDMSPFSFSDTSRGNLFIDFCKKLGLDFFERKEDICFNLPSETQFMIQTGIRLFKGYEFDDLKILTFDIETRAQKGNESVKDAALSPHYGEIFLFGIHKSNGEARVIKCEGAKEEEFAIEEFFKEIKEYDPDIVLGYNSEEFDIPFILGRLKRVKGLEGDEEVEEYIRSLLSPEDENFSYPYFNRKKAVLKVGGSSKRYVQTNMYSRNVLDGIHCIWKLQAIDKRKSASLKFNVKYEKISKDDRVYVSGNLIGAIYSDEANSYLWNKKNGHWLKNGIEIVTEKSFFSPLSINVSENGTRFYDKKNTLYVNTSKGPDSGVTGCANVITFDCTSKGAEIFIQSVRAALPHFSQICFPFKRMLAGIQDEGSKKALKNFMFWLSDNKNNLKEIVGGDFFADYEIVQGREIVERYLDDDLWETIELFKKTGQSSFLLCKWLPHTPQRAYTMGYASMWKSILSSYFYKEKLGVPEYEKMRDFNGGLIGMFSSGFNKQVVKKDASSLYPAAYLAYVPAPDWDFKGITKRLLRFYLETRLKYKAEKNRAFDEGDFVLGKLMSVLEHPLKIFINAFFGFLAAVNISPFSSVLSSHGITANSRQFTRHLIWWKSLKGYKPIYCHTDGINFVYDDVCKSEVYTGRGRNWLVKKGKTYDGVAASLAKYNDEFMPDLMGVDIDGIYFSCMNMGKSNTVFAKEKGGEMVIEIVGGLVKSDTKEYISKFVDEALPVLMAGDSVGYIKRYVEYCEKIALKKIKGKDIASYVKLKSVDEYRAMKGNSTIFGYIQSINKKYKPGDMFYYYNSGEDDGDKTSTKEKIVSINADDWDAKKIADFKIMAKNLNRLRDYLLGAHEEGVLVFAKKRIDKQQMEKCGYPTDGIDFSKSLVEKSFMLSKMEEWDEAEVKIVVKGGKKMIEIFLKKTVFNICELPAEKFDDLVEYNANKYLSAFYSAIEPIHLGFTPKTREMLKDLALSALPQLGEDWGSFWGFPHKKHFFGSLEYDLISGTPIQGKEEKQQLLEDIMQMSPEEKPYWRDSLQHPMFILNSEMMPSKKVYMLDENYHFTDDKHAAVLLLKPEGVIDYHGHHNFYDCA